MNFVGVKEDYTDTAVELHNSYMEDIRFPNTEKRVENMTARGVFLTKFEVFENQRKHCLKCLIYRLNQNKN